MVFQCNDCKMWFRSQSKFDNHKKGVLGLTCSVGIDSESKDGPHSIEKQNQITDSTNASSDFDVSDDEEGFFNRNQSAQINANTQEYDDIADEEISGEDEKTEENVPITRIPEPGNDTGESSEINREKPAGTEAEARNPAGGASQLGGETEDITLSDDEGLSEAETHLQCGESEEVTLVCVHLDTLRVSGEVSARMCQLGCTTALSSLPPAAQQTFFSPIKPDGLEHFLDNYKMEGDLLKALHITESENGKFEFRAQFEIKRKEKNKIYCSTEEEATENIRNYLKQFKKIVLFGVDRDTVVTLLKRVNLDGSIPVEGILTWSDVLTFSTNYLGPDTDIYRSDLDLEDFYTEHCGKVSGYINTLDVSTFLKKSIGMLFHEYVKKLSQGMSDVKFTWYEIFKEIIQSQHIEGEAETGGEAPTDTARLNVEVYSSFRPAVATNISMEKMETVQLSSGGESEDSDIGVLHENIVNKDTRRKMMLRQRLRKTFEIIQAKKRMLRQHPNNNKRRRIASDGPITISSDSDSDTEGFNYQKVVKSFRDRGLNTNLYPVRFPTPRISLVPNCTICHIEFGNVDALNKHVFQLHLKCVPCNRQFSDLSLALTHRTLQHTDILLQEENDYIFGV